MKESLTRQGGTGGWRVFLRGTGSKPGLFHFCISLYVECLEIFVCGLVW